MGSANGFEYEARADGTVVITYHGRRAAVLRGARAAEFLDDVSGDGQGTDPQVSMARWTGHYKHGNERAAKQHPRNRR